METCVGIVKVLCIFSSYRTYEEWKHTRNWKTSCECKVLTVPMRNGNEGVDIYGDCVYRVLTVPMRNGNKITDIFV